MRGQGQLRTNDHFLRAGMSAVALMVGAFCLGAGSVLAQSPEGGVVAAGAASISQTATTSVIQQSSQRAIIDWKGFNVGRDHSVVFDQPGSN